MCKSCNAIWHNDLATLWTKGFYPWHFKNLPRFDVTFQPTWFLLLSAIPGVGLIWFFLIWYFFLQNQYYLNVKESILFAFLLLVKWNVGVLQWVMKKELLFQVVISILSKSFYHIGNRLVFEWLISFQKIAWQLLLSVKNSCAVNFIHHCDIIRWW